MKIKYQFADGTTTEVDVSEEIGAVIIDSRKAEHAQDERQRYHCPYSYDAIDYEGEEYAADDTPETEHIRSERDARLYTALAALTETQRRRLLMLADGLSLREIARREKADIKTVRESIEGARKKFQKNF